MKMIRNENGFTLIELMTYLALAGISFMGVYYIFLKSITVYTSVIGISSSIQDAQKASEFVVRESQNLKDKNSILIANNAEFKFTNVSGTVVDLVFASQQLKKNTTVFADHITSFSFSYYKWDGTAWSTGSETNLIAKIRFVMTITFNGNSYATEDYVLLRNAR